MAIWWLDAGHVERDRPLVECSHVAIRRRNREGFDRVIRYLLHRDFRSQRPPEA